MNIFDVSVVIAAKNESRYIVEAINSILSQDGVSYELIVVDDGSTDGMYDLVLNKFQEKLNFKLYKNTKSGKCSAFNYGVSMAKGRYVCIFAGDDIMPAGSLRARFDVVKNCSDEDCVIGLCKILTMSEDRRYDGHLVPKRSGQSSYSGVSPLMNKRALDKIFPVPESLPNEDTWMELAILNFSNWIIINSDVIGCQWRCHSGNSINMMAGFDVYNKKMAIRMTALSIFYERYSKEISHEARLYLKKRIKCEEMRQNSSIFGVVTSGVSLIDVLRAMSHVNKYFFFLRKNLYGFFTGW